MTSTLFQHAESFYDALDERAKDEVWNNELHVRVFRGRVSTIFRSLGISQTYYGRVKSGLVESGCVTFNKTGSRSQESEVLLHHRPIEVEFLRRQGRPLTKSLELAIVTQRLGGIETLVGGINVVEALAELESRLRQQDSRITQVERELQAARQTKPQRR
jgi:hypothetical protein